MAEITAPAGETCTVLSAVPAHSDALPFLPYGNTGPGFVDNTSNFVSGNARVLNAGPTALFREHVTVANATSLNFDAHFSWAGFGYLTINDLEIAAGFGNLRCFHWR
jgi:hypothetical protein